jgi:hypothetical protein
VCATQGTDASSIEYRLTGLTKAMNEVVAYLIILGGIAIGYYLITPRHRNLPLEFIPAIMIGLGYYLLRIVHRARILIEPSQITVASAFDERTVPLAAIVGVFSVRGGRFGTVTGKALKLRDGTSLNISLQTFDLDQRFWDWLGQFPDLDKRT